MRFGDFRTWAASWWAGVFGQTRISRVGEGPRTTDVVRMADPTARDGETVIELTRLEQFGDVVCPPPDTNAVIWRKSDGGVVMSLAVPSARPSDCKAGDRGLYSDQAGTRIVLHGSRSATPGAIEARNATGAGVLVSKDGDVVLTDKSGHTATLSNGVLAVEDTVAAQHLAGRGGAPTASGGSAVGGGSAAILLGSDTAFVLLLSVSTGSPGLLATVTFNKPYDFPPLGVPAPGALTDNAAIPPVAGSFVANTSADKLEVSTTTTLPDGVYLLSFVVIR